MAAPSGTPTLLRAAFVRRPHGVRGTLRIEPLGGDAARFVPGLRLHVEGEDRQVTVVSAAGLPDGDVLLSCEEVGRRELAETLRDRYLCVPAEERRGLAEDEWFVYEIVGLRCVTPSGEAVGTVDDVEHYAAQDVLVVRDPTGRIRRMPLVRAFVRRVDLVAGEVEVTPWPEDGEEQAP